MLLLAYLVVKDDKKRAARGLALSVWCTLRKLRVSTPGGQGGCVTTWLTHNGRWARATPAHDLLLLLSGVFLTR